MVAGISTRNRATMEKSSLLLKLKACAGQRIALFERLDWKTPCLMDTLANQLRSSQKDTWAFYASVDGLSLGTNKSWHISLLKSAWRDHTHSMFCTICHKIDITTGYLCCCFVVVVSHIQRFGCQPEKTTLHGGQSRSWSAEQGKETKRKSLAAYPPPTPHTARSEKINKITRRIYRRYAGGRSRVRSRIPSARRLGLWMWLRKILHSRLR